MRENQIRVAILAILVATLGTPSGADADPASACAEIRSACEAAGFVRGGAKTGNGLRRDCIAPIMSGTVPSRGTTKPLPHVAASLVADCKSQKSAAADFRRGVLGEVMQHLFSGEKIIPNFGQRRTPPSQEAEPESEVPAPEASPQPDGKQQI
jgi:hypothetical protein